MSREDVIRLARSELGLSDASKYWRVVMGPVGGYPPHWCGAFALWCLREAGLTDWPWVIGKGFLWRLPRTTSPQPGDIGYQDQPFQHHFVVEEVSEHTLSSIDGNQGTPGVQRRSRAVGDSKLAFFSIESLLRRDTDPAPPPYPVLKLGSEGADVVVLQGALNRYMHAGLREDGQFGPKTDAALRMFQRDKDLVVDGICGPKTWAVLVGP